MKLLNYHIYTYQKEKNIVFRGAGLPRRHKFNRNSRDLSALGAPAERREYSKNKKHSGRRNALI
jgi:hypothetical protein